MPATTHAPHPALPSAWPKDERDRKRSPVRG